MDMHVVGIRSCESKRGVFHGVLWPPRGMRLIMDGTEVHSGAGETRKIKRITMNAVLRCAFPGQATSHYGITKPCPRPAA